MKHIYLTLFLAVTGSASAQTILNAGFEGSIAPGANAGTYPSVTDVESWNRYLADYGIYYSLNATAETVNPGEGMQSVVLTNMNDAATAGVLQYDGNIVEGMIEQIVPLSPGINAANIVTSFLYQVTTAGEEAAIFLQVVDTNEAGTVDDFVLFEGEMNFPSTVSEWTAGAIALTPTSTTGEANAMVIKCSSSRNALLSQEPQSEGTQLKLDAFKIGYLGLEETSAMAVSAYPNPATDVLHIQSETPIVQVIVLNADGRAVLTATSTDITTSDLAPGSYFYEATGVNGMVARNSFVKR